MTHLKECMQRQLLKSPKLSFGLAKFQLPLSVLLKRVPLSNKDRCGEQRACIRCKELPSSDDFLSKKHNYYCIEFNVLSSFHRQARFYLTAFGDVSTNSKAPKLCKDI